MDEFRSTAAAALGALRVRMLEDRLARWSIAAVVAVLWLSVALANARLVLLAPLGVLLLVALFRYGPYARFERPDELF